MYVENLHLQLTRNCTLECEHCLRGDRENVDMSIKVFDEVFNDIKKVEFLLLTGGEPLLNIPVLERLVELLKSKAIRVNKIILITNGTVLNDRVLEILHELQTYSYLSLKLSTDIFHSLEIEKKGLSEIRDKNLKILSSSKFYNFSEYGKDKDSPIPVGLINKGKARLLTSERLAEINELSKQKFIINDKYDEQHPLTSIDGDIIDGNITINVYGYVVSYGLSFEEEDKEAYDKGLNIMEMTCGEAIRAFINIHQNEMVKFYKKLGLEYNSETT